MPHSTAHLLHAIQSTARANQRGTALCFLYETPTLQKLMLHLAASRRGKSFSTSSRRLRSRRTPSSPVSFASYGLGADAAEEEPAERGTITEKERATFNRIFQRITDLRASGPRVAEDPTDEQSEESTDGGPSDTLEDIFDSAKKAIHQTYNESTHRPYSPRKGSKEEIQRAQALEAEVYQNAKSYPPSLRAAYQRLAASLSNPTSSVRYKRLELTPSEALEQSLEMEHQRASQWLSAKPTVASKDREFAEYEQRVLHRRKIDLNYVTDLFTTVKCDIDVWTILERQVFPQVEALNALIRKEAMARADYEAAKKKPEATSTALSSATPPPPPAVDLRVVHPLSILQTNFAIHCFNAMHLLRTRFPASPYAPSLISQVKSLGPIAYVLGASTALYNELLYIRWKHYRDLHACADLVQEMLDQGVETNHVSHAVFRDARWQRHNARLAAKGLDAQVDPDAPAARWWELRGVVDGWARWTAVDAEARRREEENIARVQKEGMELRQLEQAEREEAEEEEQALEDEEDEEGEEDEESEEAFDGEALRGDEKKQDKEQQRDEEVQIGYVDDDEVVHGDAVVTDVLRVGVDDGESVAEARVDDGDVDIEIAEVVVPPRSGPIAHTL